MIKLKKPANPEPIRMMRIRQVSATVGLGQSTIYKLVAAGEFPPPVKLRDTKKAPIAWPEHVIQAWLQERIAASAKAAA